MPADLAIIAGAGDLPRRLAHAARAAGRGVFIVAFEGHTDPATVDGWPHLWSRFGAAAEIIDTLRQAGIGEMVFAGPVRRPSLTDIRPDWRAAKFLMKVGRRAFGDDGLLSAIAHALEEEGFRIIGIHDVMADLLAPPGLLAGPAPDETARADCSRGLAVARTLGHLDVGQAVVVQQGLVLALEGIEGTDAMIARAGTLRRAGPGGVLVKLRKPQQDRRMDLPAIGPGTVAAAAAAGLRGVVMEAGGTLLLHREETMAAAAAGGMFLLALEPAAVAEAAAEAVKAGE